MRLELLQGFWGIVDESETSCLSATELSLETENVDLVLVGLVHFGKLASEFILGDVGSVWVEDITIKTSRLEPVPSIDTRIQLCDDREIRSMGVTYTTICLRPRRGLRMNLRVRKVTGCSRSAMFAYGRRSVRRSACEVSRQKSGV
jgi:hypothetical protein